LRDFAQCAAAQGDTHVVTHTAMAWAAQATAEPQRPNRLHVVVRCARFRHAAEARHDLPPTQVFWGQRHRPTPSLFREQDLQAFITHATRLGPPGSLRPHTSSPLWARLAVTGLRLSAALALWFQDVTPDGLVMRATKFRTSRLVPWHETTMAALPGYWDKRCARALDDTHLFVSGQRRPLSDQTVRATFHRLVAAAGMPAAPGRRRPRLMDLRHPFAARA